MMGVLLGILSFLKSAVFQKSIFSETVNFPKTGFYHGSYLENFAKQFRDDTHQDNCQQLFRQTILTANSLIKNPSRCLK